MMSGLWKNHPATPRQRSLFSKATRKRRAQPTQADVMVAMLRKARASEAALELPDILQSGIAQFTARIFELRQRGFVIENEMERSPDGRMLSRYWLRHDPEQGGEQ
jgi:Helix-turn-helix domain